MERQYEALAGAGAMTSRLVMTGARLCTQRLNGFTARLRCSTAHASPFESRKTGPAANERGSRCFPLSKNLAAKHQPKPVPFYAPPAAGRLTAALCPAERRRLRNPADLQIGRCPGDRNATDCVKTLQARVHRCLITTLLGKFPDC